MHIHAYQRVHGGVYKRVHEGMSKAVCCHVGRGSHLQPDREEAAVDTASAQRLTLLLEVGSLLPEAWGDLPEELLTRGLVTSTLARSAT